MPLLLKSVPASRGPRWIGDAWSLYRRKALAFTAMFCVFMFAAVVVAIVPVLGTLVQLMALPLLTLGFMVASQAALLGDMPHPRHFIEPLRGDPARRKSLLLLCVSFGLLAVAVVWICEVASGNALSRMQALISRGEAAEAELEALMLEPAFRRALLLGVFLGTLLSVPYWHAAALVHWGGQSAPQALFSSTLALWRNKGAFLLFALAWIGLVLLFSMVAGLLLGILGLGAIAGFVALTAGLVFTTLFYVAQLFTFNDSFGGAMAGHEPTDPAEPTGDTP